VAGAKWAPSWSSEKQEGAGGRKNLGPQLCMAGAGQQQAAGDRWMCIDQDGQPESQTTHQRPRERLREGKGNVRKRLGPPLRELAGQESLKLVLPT
jgi:hypothetical protein